METEISVAMHTVETSNTITTGYLVYGFNVTIQTSTTIIKFFANLNRMLLRTIIKKSLSNI